MKPHWTHSRQADAIMAIHRRRARAGRRSRPGVVLVYSVFLMLIMLAMLSLAVDFDYHDLREREYPLLAAPALAERLRHVAGLFPANAGYEFQILYRRKG